tara:strand:+ start:429 stop:1262 length:834 start_codon:yes stop_codon:yes gene_type:complete
MDYINIHKEITTKLDFFIKNKKIPHIIFYGDSGSGKRFILNNFIKKIYNNNNKLIKDYVMYVNCAHGKGIRFIRDELKFFAKTNIQNLNGVFFKSIVLFNAGWLTTDAQSALRRCIEQFSHNTRVFIVIEDTDCLLKPILSRFCNIYIPLPTINNKRISLHSYNINNIDNDPLYIKKDKYFNNIMTKYYNRSIQDKNKLNVKEIYKISHELYYKGYHAKNIIDFLEKTKIKIINKYKLLIYYDKIRKQFRQEILLIFFCLNYLYLRKNIHLDNIMNI